MVMDREELLKALNFVKPALASRDFVPMFTNFCFYGESVSAYNDVLGIEFPCKTDFIGAIKGDALLAGLEYSTAQTVDFVASKENEILIKVGTRKLRYPISSKEDFIFEFPDTDGLPEVVINSAYQDAIKHCVAAVGTDASRREAMGITFVFGDHVTAYSTDSATVSRYEVGVNDYAGMFGKSVIIPTEFCKLIISGTVSSITKEVKVKISDDFIVADLAPGCRVFSKLINSDPLEFGQHFEQYLGEAPEELVPFPKGFFNKLAPTVTIVEMGSSGTCKIDIEGGRMKIEAISEYHQELKDTVKLSGEHANVSATIDPALLVRVLHLCDRFYVLPDCLLLSGDEGRYTHLIGHMAS